MGPLREEQHGRKAAIQKVSWGLPALQSWVNCTGQLRKRHGLCTAKPYGYWSREEFLYFSGKKCRIDRAPWYSPFEARASLRVDAEVDVVDALWSVAEWRS